MAKPWTGRRVVLANAFELYDPDGNLAGRWTADDRRTELVFLHGDREAVNLVLTKGEMAYLTMRAANGMQSRLVLNLEQGAFMAFDAPDRGPIASIGVCANPHLPGEFVASTSLFSAPDDIRLGLQLNNNMPLIAMAQEGMPGQVCLIAALDGLNQFTVGPDGKLSSDLVPFLTSSSKGDASDE